jgi:hypothetical protein
VIRILQRAAISSALLGFALASVAQTPTNQAEAQRRFDAQIAKCNSGNLPAPERDACVRKAGHDLDRARGAPPRNVTTRTPDRRSTVVTPEGAPVPPSGTTTVRTPDRRSTVVSPDGSPVPSSGSASVRSPDGRSTVVPPADQPSR